MMFQRSATVAGFTALSVAVALALGATPAQAAVLACPSGTYQQPLVVETSEEYEYLDALVQCVDDVGMTRTLLNNSDSAWWFPDASGVTVHARDDRSLMFHRAMESHDPGWAPFILPGDWAELPYGTDTHFYLDAGHTAGWVLAKQLVDQVQAYGKKAVGYLVRSKGKVSKAVWECSEGAVNLGFALAGDREQLADPKVLVKAGLGAGKTATSCKQAWNDAAKQRLAKKMKLPSFGKATVWTKSTATLSRMAEPLEWVLRVCSSIPKLC